MPSSRDRPTDCNTHAATSWQRDAFPMAKFSVSWWRRPRLAFLSASLPLRDPSRHSSSLPRREAHPRDTSRRVASRRRESQTAGTFTEATHTRNSSCHSVPSLITRICTSNRPLRRSCSRTRTHSHALSPVFTTAICSL